MQFIATPPVSNNETNETLPRAVPRSGNYQQSEVAKKRLRLVLNLISQTGGEPCGWNCAAHRPAEPICSTNRGEEYNKWVEIAMEF